DARRRARRPLCPSRQPASGIPRRAARPGRASGSSHRRRRSGRAETLRPARLEEDRAPPYPLPVIRVVLADDHYLFREGIQRLLVSVSDVEVAAVCNDLDSLLDAVDAKRPDVVVTDIRMPPGNADEGIQAAERLRETHPDVGVVVLSQYTNPTYALALLDRGSAGRAYLLKERVDDADRFVGAIRAVAEG